MGETFLAVWTLIRFFTTVNSQVFLQMVFIFEGLATLSAFELTIACSLGQHLVLICPWLVCHHMPLELGAVGKRVVTERAREVLLVLLVAVLDVLLEGRQALVAPVAVGAGQQLGEASGVPGGRSFSSCPLASGVPRRDSSSGASG